MLNFKEIDKEYVADTYGRFDLTIVKGKGSYCYDENGKKYIDLNGGIAVNTFGFCDKIWQKAVKKQIGLFQHTSNLFYSSPCALLAKKLCEKSGAKKVFFSNSGAEANECAIKCARLWGETNKGKEYYNIITLKNGFHGRTITTLSATGQDVFHEHFTPMTDGFLFATADDEAQVDKLLSENKCCAVMVELIQGEGGVSPLNKNYVFAVKTLCEKHNVLLIIDEVQTGNGRSGALYAYMRYGVEPDIVSTAKGLAGGLPIGATMLFDKTQNVFYKGSHGSTFGGNPVSCAAAISVIDRIDDKLLKEVNEKSEYVIDALKNAEGVIGVSGLGLMLGIEVKCDASKVISTCIERGVIPIKAKNKIRLLPALNIPLATLKEAVEIIKGAIKDNL